MTTETIVLIEGELDCRSDESTRRYEGLRHRYETKYKTACIQERLTDEEDEELKAARTNMEMWDNAHSDFIKHNWH